MEGDLSLGEGTNDVSDGHRARHVHERGFLTQRLDDAVLILDVLGVLLVDELLELIESGGQRIHLLPESGCLLLDHALVLLDHPVREAPLQERQQGRQQQRAADVDQDVDGHPRPLPHAFQHAGHAKQDDAEASPCRDPVPADPARLFVIPRQPRAATLLSRDSRDSPLSPQLTRVQAARKSASRTGFSTPRSPATSADPAVVR